MILKILRIQENFVPTEFMKMKGKKKKRKIMNTHLRTLNLLKRKFLILKNMVQMINHLFPLMKMLITLNIITTIQKKLLIWWLISSGEKIPPFSAKWTPLNTEWEWGPNQIMISIKTLKKNSGISIRLKN